jgi:hypothetical protein
MSGTNQSERMLVGLQVATSIPYHQYLFSLKPSSRDLPRVVVSRASLAAALEMPCPALRRASQHDTRWGSNCALTCRVEQRVNNRLLTSLCEIDVDGASTPCKRSAH